MKAKELRNLSESALQTRAVELFAEVSTLRFQGLQKEKNVKKLRTLRRERARVLTVLQERSLEADRLRGGTA